MDKEFKEYLHKCAHPEDEDISEETLVSNGIGKGYHTMKEIVAYSKTLPKFVPDDKDFEEILEESEYDI